jgi:hypothetical protein
MLPMPDRALPPLPPPPELLPLSGASAAPSGRGFTLNESVTPSHASSDSASIVTPSRPAKAPARPPFIEADNDDDEDEDEDEDEDDDEEEEEEKLAGAASGPAGAGRGRGQARSSSAPVACWRWCCACA